MIKQIFINLSVKDLKKTTDFFTKLGFKFNQKFTDENAKCLVIGENIYAMLLAENFFQSFTDKKICDSLSHIEAILAVSVACRSDVDELVDAAKTAGGVEPKAPQDEGWMYGRSFEDLDGHLWEVIYMDQKEIDKLPVS